VNVLDLRLTPEVLASLGRNRSVNRVHLEGRVGTHPASRRVSSSLQATTFRLVTAESWGDPAKYHPNVMTIEVLGKDSGRAREFSVGDWVTLDGYIRTEVRGPGEDIRIRTFSVKGFDPAGEVGV
tara:strand:+ start:469 stop:843 length:375 start_codon:yes stop_codon:yes gene_type:complete